jgi:fluoride exporter
MNLLYIIFGGSLGAVARYLVSIKINDAIKQTLPFATLFVNTTGSFCIGFLFVFFEKANVPNELRLLSITGFLGAYTTFSTYSLDTMRLMLEGKPGMAALNFILNNGLCLLMVFLGLTLSKALFSGGK